MSVFSRTFSDVLLLTGKKSLLLLFLAILGSLFLTLIELAVAAILNLFLASFGLVELHVVPEILRPYAIQSPETICLLLIGIGLIRFIGQVVSQYSAITFKQNVSLRFRETVIKRILFSKSNLGLSKGEIYTTISDILPKASSFIFNALQIVSSLIYSSFLLISLLYLAWTETIVGLSGLLLIGIISMIVQKRFQHLANSLPLIFEKFNKSIDRITTNWQFIKIYRSEHREFDNLNQQNVLLHKRFNLMKLIEVVNGGVPQFLGMVIVAAILLVGNSKGFGSNMISFLYLFLRFAQRFSSIAQIFSSSIQSYPYFRLALQRNREYLAETNFKKQSNSSSDNLDQAPCINIKDLTFSWSKPKQNTVFSNFNLHIPKGTSIGIMGKSGAGKSTLLNLVLGRILPDGGSVQINNLTVDKFMEVYSSSLAYVGPIHFLYDGTIRENLCYGIDSLVSEEAIIDSLKKAEIYERILNLPDGIDYHFSSTNDVFSSGEKQRLSIARALIRKPKIMILDEASANLDQETESSISDTLDDVFSECTTIAVSHSQNFLKFCDRVIKI